MSNYMTEEVVLEDNIKTKETELLHLIAEDIMQYIDKLIFPDIYPRQNYCNELTITLPDYSFNQETQYSNPAPYNYHITENRAYHQNFDSYNMENTALIMRELHLQSGDNFTSSSNSTETHEIIYPIYSNKTQTNMRKIKTNKKKNYSNNSSNISYNLSHRKADDVINIAELGLGPQFNTKSESTVLVMKFRRLYFYLTALCKERRILESIILSAEFTPNGKYILTADNDLIGHLDYTRQSLSIEIDMIESLLHYIQEKCNDAMRPFIKLCRDLITDFLDTIRDLNSFDKILLLRKSGNSDELSKLDNIVSNLIHQCRYLSINYTLLAQKLLIKETNMFENRRKMFIGR